MPTEKSAHFNGLACLLFPLKLEGEERKSETFADVVPNRVASELRSTLAGLAVYSLQCIILMQSDRTYWKTSCDIIKGESQVPLTV